MAVHRERGLFHFAPCVDIKNVQVYRICIDKQTVVKPSEKQVVWRRNKTFFE